MIDNICKKLTLFNTKTLTVDISWISQHSLSVIQRKPNLEYSYKGFINVGEISCWWMSKVISLNWPKNSSS